MILLLGFIFYTEIETRVSYHIEDPCLPLGRIRASKTILWYYSILVLLSLAGANFLRKRVWFMALLLVLVSIFMLKMVYTDAHQVITSKKRFEAEEWKSSHPLAMVIYIKNEMNQENITPQEVIHVLGEPTSFSDGPGFVGLIYETDEGISLRFRILKGKVISCGWGC